MSLFQVLPAETKFYDWFEKGADNLVAAATLLDTMLDDGQDWAGRVAQMTELEHQGDFITHEIFDLLHKTFITPLDHAEIQELIQIVDKELPSIPLYTEPNVYFISKRIHGTANGIFGLAALIQVCATLPDNFIAFEYPARFEPFWYEITEGFDGVPVRNGMIDVPDRPGLGVDLIPQAARKHLSEGDADFFD